MASGEKYRDENGRWVRYGLRSFWNSPFMLYPGLIMLFIMPAAILFHPTWVVPIAVFETFAMMCIIFKLTRA